MPGLEKRQADSLQRAKSLSHYQRTTKYAALPGLVDTDLAITL